LRACRTEEEASYRKIAARRALGTLVYGVEGEKALPTKNSYKNHRSTMRAEGDAHAAAVGSLSFFLVVVVVIVVASVGT